MNNNATTWWIDFSLDPQGELPYCPTQEKGLLITSPYHLLSPPTSPLTHNDGFPHTPGHLKQVLYHDRITEESE